MKNQWLINNMEPHLHNVWVKPSSQAWKCQEHLGCVGFGSKFLMACAGGTDLSEIICNPHFPVGSLKGGCSFPHILNAKFQAYVPCSRVSWDLGDHLWTLSPWCIQRLGLTFPSEKILWLDYTIFCLGSEECYF